MSPENLESTREVILCIALGDDDAEVFQQSPWAERWTLVTQEPPDTIAEKFDPVLRLRPGTGVPQLSSAGGTLLISELDQFESALGDENWTRIIFVPSAAAVLDAMKPQRETLTVRCNLNRGHILKCEDMSVEVGGEGVSANLLDIIAGQALCYDLNEGEPITFGMIAAINCDDDNTSESPGTLLKHHSAHIQSD